MAATAISSAAGPAANFAAAAAAAAAGVGAESIHEGKELSQQTCRCISCCTTTCACSCSMSALATAAAASLTRGSECIRLVQQQNSRREGLSSSKDTCQAGLGLTCVCICICICICTRVGAVGHTR